MSPEIHDPELAALAKALTALAPHVGRLDRDRLLFCAGQASLRRTWFWPGSAAVLALLAAAMGWSEVRRPAPQHVHCVVYRRVEPPVAPASLWADRPSVAEDAPPGGKEPDRQAATLSYLRLQRLVLALGADALPNPPVADALRGQEPLLSPLSDLLSPNTWLARQSP